MCLSVHPSVHLSPHAPATQFADCGQASVAVPAQCGKGVETAATTKGWTADATTKGATKGGTAAATTNGGTADATTKGATKGGTAAATTKGATKGATTKVPKPTSTSVESVDAVIGGAGDKRRASAEAESGSQPKKQLTIFAAFRFSNAQVSERGPY